jgi:hypothetical protein
MGFAGNVSAFASPMPIASEKASNPNLRRENELNMDGLL